MQACILRSAFRVVTEYRSVPGAKRMVYPQVRQSGCLKRPALRRMPQLEAREFIHVYFTKEYGILTWLAVLMQNRTFNIDTPLGREAFRYLKDTFSIDTHSYDAICGYRADDSYFSFAQDFINGAISYQQLRAAMYLGEMGEQFVVVSERAFAQLRYKRCEKAMRGDWLFKKLERDRKARTEYLTSDRFKYQKGGLYVATILDEEIKPGDKRLT